MHCIYNVVVVVIVVVEIFFLFNQKNLKEGKYERHQELQSEMSVIKRSYSTHGSTTEKSREDTRRKPAREQVGVRSGYSTTYHSYV